MSTRRIRDKDKTILDILTASRHLFSERGLYGTSIRSIENASGVSKGLILHHFRTKEDLYAAVQDLLAKEYIEMMSAQRQSSADFQKIFAASTRNSFLHTKGNRDYHRIALWAYLEGKERHTELEQRFRMALITAMCTGQQSGLVRDDIDVSLMPFIIKGTIDYWIQKENLIEKLTADEKIQEGGLDDRLIDALTRLFLK